MDNQMMLFPKEPNRQVDSWFTESTQKLGVTGYGGGWPDNFGAKIRTWLTSHNAEAPRVLSLFSGAGGLDIGFHDIGFTILECNEIERDFAASLEANSSSGGYTEGSRIVCKDIAEYHPGETDIDFVIGGPPCQTFSAAGARAAGVNGTDDARGNLFLQYARILKEVQPRGFLFENVYRIVGAQGGKPWEAIQKAFLSLGYKLFWRVLNAADYGAPQFRERLIIVGLKQGTYRFPYPSHGPDSTDGREYYSAGESLEGLEPQVSPKSSIGGRHGHLLEDIPPGLNYSYYTEQMGHPTPYFAWRAKFSDYLYKADPCTPVRTIKAQGGQYTGPFHWDSRVFTIDELKRLQTFPDKYLIVGRRQKAIHQIGNSVPPQFARILALSIADQVFSQEVPSSIEYMSETYELGFRKRKRQLTKVYQEKATAAIMKQRSVTGSTKHEKLYSTYVDVDHELRLIESSSRDGLDFHIDCDATDPGNITILLTPSDSKYDPKQLDYCIVARWVAPDLKSGIRSSYLEMSSYSRSPKSLLTLWKYFESIISKLFFKDDLVQLFGYYKSRRQIDLKCTVHNSKMPQSEFWSVAKGITDGIAVGRILHIDQLAELFGLNNSEMIQALVYMKEIGYEIRSHSTNRQIPNGKYLIPYQFPSMSERSLQRLTEL